MRSSSHFQERAKARLERVRQHQSSTPAVNPAPCSTNNNKSNSRTDNDYNNSDNNNSNQTTAQHQAPHDGQHPLVTKHAYTPRTINPQQPATQLTAASLRAMQSVLPSQPQNTQFTTHTWWIVDRQYRPRLLHGATPVVMRCMRVYGWSEAYARRVLNGYKQFLQLKTSAQDWDGTLLEPSKEINRLWQQHILDVVNYVYDCILLCGRVLGHLPDADEYYVERRQRRCNTKEALEKVFSDVDAEVWREVVMISGNGEEGEMDDFYEEANHEEQQRQPAEERQRDANKERQRDSKNDSVGNEETREMIHRTASPRKSNRPVRPKMLSRRERRARSPRREHSQPEKSEQRVESPKKVVPKYTARVEPKLSRPREEQRFSSPPSRQRHDRSQPNTQLSSQHRMQQSPVYHVEESRPRGSSPTYRQSRDPQRKPTEKHQRQQQQQQESPANYYAESPRPRGSSPTFLQSQYPQLRNRTEKQHGRPTTPVIDVDALGMHEIEPVSPFRGMGGDERECRADLGSPRVTASTRQGPGMDSGWGITSFEEIEVELEDCDRGFDPIDARRQEYQEEVWASDFHRSSPQVIIATDIQNEEIFSPDIDVPSLDTPDDHKLVKVQIRDQDGVMSSRVRRNTRMIKILSAYADDKGVKLKNLHFFLNGRIIEASDTPSSLNLRDHDKIECVMGHPKY